MAANQQTFTQWGSGYDPYATVNPQTHMGPAPVFRNAKDARLASYGATPEAQYPDGYLGTMSSNRRQDKILDGVARTNTRPYSRGVHKGERINQGDYIWPDQLNLMTGVMLQAKGMKFAPTMSESGRLTNDGKQGPRGVPGRPSMVEMNDRRRSMLKSLAPRWR